MKNKINVMLVEDNPDYREVVSLALEDEKDIELTSTFGTAEVALRSVQDPDPNTKPALILLDLRLPGMDGLHAIDWFKKYSPSSKIIILTQSDDEADVLKAISQGASGYLLKSSTVDQITEGIRTVIDGGASLDARVAKFILETLQTTMPKSGEKPNLSEREMEVLSLLADGHVKKEIAKKLDIGTSTVVTHVNHIYAKLDATNAPSAINKAHKLGLFPSDEAEGESADSASRE